MKQTVCLEIGSGGAGAFIPECPGCWVFGRTSERLLQKVGSAAAAWFQWLDRHGDESSVRSGQIDVFENEILRVSYNPVEAGKPEPLFWSEVLPVGEKQIERTKQLMGYARQDLLALVDDLPAEVLDWQPPGKPRTIRNCLEHIGRVEWWYLTRLEVELSDDLPKDVFVLLAAVRKMVWRGLDVLPSEKYGGIFQPRKYVGSEGRICNLWTARKVLRRFVDHERLHTRYIDKILKMYPTAEEARRCES